MGVSDEDLLELAGPGPFDRGYDYYRDGRVIELETRRNHVVAMVSGTHLYRVELSHDEQQLDGACNCPASEGIVFCKHCVATALELRDHLTESALAGTDNEDDDILKVYLAEQDPEILVSHLMQVLPKDPLLHEKLCRQALLATGSVDANQLKQSITRVTPLRDIFEQRQVSSYFRRLETTLQGIMEIAEQIPAEVLLETALHGIRRLNKALERIDDSGGYRDHSQAMLRDLHGQSLQRIAWTPEQRAEHLLELALGDPWDQFAGNPFDYAEALGQDGLNAFYTSVETRLQALPELPNDARSEDKLPHYRLTNYLMVRAREQDDYDEMIRLTKLTATTEIDFERIARLYLESGGPDEAAKWLSKADALDKHDRNSRKQLWATVHAAMGNWEAAVMALESAFRRDASYENYKQLMEYAEQAGNEKIVRGSVKTFLCSEEQPHSWVVEYRSFTLAQILRDEQEWSALTETALGKIRDPDRLLKVARWMAKSAVLETRPVYEKAIDALIARKTNHSYRAATEVLLEARPAFDAAGVSAFDDFIAQLKETHFRKRNFIAELDARIGSA